MSQDSKNDTEPAPRAFLITFTATCQPKSPEVARSSVES